MIIDSLESRLISNRGWVDHGAIWCCDTATAKWKHIPLSQAAETSYIAIHRGSEDLFAAVHHFNRNELIITAHAIASPEQTIVSIKCPGRGQEPIWEGAVTVWQHLPRAYQAHYYYKWNR